MRRVLNTPRKSALKLRLWETEMLRHALLAGGTTYFVASSRPQAEKTFEVASAILNGRDPKAQSG